MATMCRALFSIRPQYVRSILDGTKRYEYRRMRCARDITGIIIYCTSPVCKVVAEAEVTDIITGDPEDVWRITHGSSGVSKEFFDRYYEGCGEAVAYAIGEVREFPEPRDLSEYGVSRAPQSFVYVDKRSAIGIHLHRRIPEPTPLRLLSLTRGRT